MKILIFLLWTVYSLVQNVSCYSHMEVEELFSEYFEWKMATHPQAATYAGYHLHSDQLDDLSLVSTFKNKILSFVTVVLHKRVWEMSAQINY
jgi:hypothetical protein